MESIIYNDDCFNIFSKIPNKSVNLVCVDLPYAQTACSWDSLIDLNKMWVELKRIGKDNCQFVFFCTTKFGYKIIESNPKWFRYDMIWEKENIVGFLSANKQPLRKHEMIYVFHNDKKPKNLKWIYNPQKTVGKPYKTKLDGICSIYNTKRIDIDNKGDRHPTSILKFGYDKEKLHPTQKPVPLCEWIIKTYSNENDVVLDFTMGSGSTIIACKNTKRHYIGIEKDKDIFEVAKKRIQDHVIL
jgi:site-specific DNA-methyltransferase (adenine-specific)